MAAINKKKLNNHKNHLVDERYELIALLFRLSAHFFYVEKATRYQRELDSKFAWLKEHPAVEYVKLNYKLYPDYTWLIAIHLEKQNNKFVLAENIDYLIQLSLTISEFAHKNGIVVWTVENAKKFVELLNDFYVDSKFAEHFKRKTRYYKRRSLYFKTVIQNDISFEWFERYGLNTNHMRIVLTPSVINGFGGFGGMVYGRENIYYACLPMHGLLTWTLNDKGWKNVVVHEFCHAFANPIAEQWYAENEMFRSWCDNTDVKKNPEYAPLGITMAGEYLTRAYTILYAVENDNGNLPQLLLGEESRFPHIKQVYEMIKTDTEPK